MAEISKKMLTESMEALMNNDADMAVRSPNGL